jgi:hypothetical protein
MLPDLKKQDGKNSRTLDFPSIDCIFITFRYDKEEVVLRMLNSTRLNRRSFLMGLGASSTAMLLAACGQPGAPAAPPSEAGSSGGAAAAPAGGKAEVARKDTLIHYGGDTEILEPTNFNPYSLGGLLLQPQ